MAHLLVAARNNSQPVQGRPQAPKEICISIFKNLSYELRGKAMTDGALAIYIPAALLEDRARWEKDRTLGVFSGLCAREQANHPSWETRLKTAAESHNGIAPLLELEMVSGSLLVFSCYYVFPNPFIWFHTVSYGSTICL